MTGLLVNTTTGPVLGFADTFSFANESKAPEVLKGEDGGLPPVAKWLGIPYAQAERWKRSVPHTPWSEPMECYDFGTTFPAPEDRNGHILFTNHGLPHRGSRLASSETSFVTNVFAPGDYKPGEKLPVLAWIHGGGLVFGNSADMVYDPTRLIRKQAERGRRVIVVSANYRLNVLGFLSSKDLAEEAGQVTGNFGLYDCVSWLEWLKVNLEAFGGDPANITIYGESAGSVLCNLLCLHPAPLFKRVILQSGAVSTMPPLSASDAEAVYQNMLAVHGITTDTHPTAASRLAALRAIDVDTLVTAFNDFPPRASRLALEHGPGAIYTDHPLAMIRAGKLNKGIDAILLGSMASEGNLFELIFPPPSQDFALALFPQANDEIRQHYTGGDLTKWNTLSGSKLITDFLFNAPIDELADTLANQGVNVHRYLIQTSIDKIDKDTNLGPCHSVSLPFLFDVDVLWNGEDDSIEGRSAKNISDVVCRFAGGDIAEGWPLLTAADPQQLVFTPEGTVTIEPVDIGDNDRLFWRKMYNRQRHAQMESKVGIPPAVGSNGVHVLAEGVKTR